MAVRDVGGRETTVLTDLVPHAVLTSGRPRVEPAGLRRRLTARGQLGFHRPYPAGDPGNHRLKAANLASVWRSFRASGADCLVAVGPLDRPDDIAPYTAALPAATITRCRLHASRRTLAERVARRGRGLKSAGVWPATS